MRNFIHDAIQKFEQEVESDRYSTSQRLAAAALGFTVIFGGFKATEHFELDESMMDGVASLIGYDEPISYDD